MKIRDGGTTVIIIIAVAALVGYFSSSWLGDDNVIEETCEDVIEQHMGIDFDISPNTVEGRDA